MKVSFKLLTQPEYQKIYYLNVLKRLRQGFFQKNGFLVLPTATLRTPAEVVFPDLDLDKEAALALEEFFKLKEHSGYEFPFITPIEQFKKTDPFVNYPHEFFNRTLAVLELEEITKKYQDSFNKVAEFLLPDNSLDVAISVIPVDFGTVGTFHPLSAQGKLTFLMTSRIDLNPVGLFKTVIAAFITLNLNTRSDAEKESAYWQKRQFLFDYMANHTGFVKLFPDMGEYKEVLQSISQLAQLGTIVKASRDYLKRLGLDFSPEIHFDGNVLFIDEKVIYLTDSEKAVFSVLYHNNGHVVTFDELGYSVWKDDESRFSMYTLAKFVSNIRKKIKDAGVMRGFIYTARGKGVLFATV